METIKQYFYFVPKYQKDITSMFGEWVTNADRKLMLQNPKLQSNVIM